MKSLKKILIVALPAALLMSLSACRKDSQINKSLQLPSNFTNLNSFAIPLTVSLYAGVANHEYGNLDGPRLLAEFAEPYGITSTPAGAFYITDNANNNIRKISPAGMVSTIPFGKQLLQPFSITTASDGSVYFLEGGRQKIRRINTDDQIQTPLEICKIGPDGKLEPFVFTGLFDIAIIPDGTIYLTDFATNSIIKRTTKGIGSVLAGGTAGYKDGKGANAQFNIPTNLAVDSNGNIYVTDNGNFRIRKVTPDGTVTTIAGSTKGFKDGIGSNAQFTGLEDIIVADNNTLVVADGYSIRTINLTTVQVTTIAGAATFGDVDGPALLARFSSIGQITIYNNSIYVAEGGVRNVRKISPL